MEDESNKQWSLFINTGDLKSCYLQSGILLIPSVDELDTKVFTETKIITNLSIREIIWKLYNGDTKGIDYKYPKFGDSVNHFGTWCVILANNHYLAEPSLNYCLSPQINNLAAAEWAMKGWLGNQVVCDIPIENRIKFDKYQEIQRLEYQLSHMKDKGAPIPLEFLIFKLRKHNTARSIALADDLEKTIPLMYVRPIEMSVELKRKCEALPLLNKIAEENMRIVADVLNKFCEKTVEISDIFTLTPSYFATLYQQQFF